MKKIIDLIRLPNLLIIAFTQYAMRYLIMEPLLPTASFSLQFSNLHFFLLVMATLFIAAAGYIINDYFDTRTDRINKPDKVVVGISVNRRTAMTMHTIFNLIGVGIGIYLSIHIGVVSVSFIFFLTAGLLWFYSTNYKRQFLVGNLTVAFLTAMVPLIVVLFEIPMLNKEYGAIMLQYNSSFNYIFIWVAGFSIFAFLTTLIREIIKDTEDFEGDAAYGMKTLPIVARIPLTKAILAVLITGTVFLLVFILVKFIMFSAAQTDYISLTYFAAFLVIPFIILLTLILIARDKADYHRASVLIKLIMLFGVMYSAVVYYLIKFWI
ncbi:MAG: geranylgeranylglycerol-phosphate geranylgeranyltransferase [Bacteroidales bacterium]|nr:geranylgeranylglycerol-phosphate geranylgeranyltransferase [Bacteroidales bacterium]MDT8431348.1 geranylgeranylglycerol-phosphate geranylgeranyltransferase [Bacteroidales bacterium]